MKIERKVFWRAVLTLIVGGIGVGMFGIPFVFAQSGVGIGLVHLIAVGVVNTVMLIAFADLIAGTKNHSRITGVVERYAGKWAGWVVTIFTFAGGWGALLAYVLVGGTFAFELLGPALGGTEVMYQLGFYGVSSLLLIGGLGFIGRIETWLSFLLIGLLVALVAGSSSQVDVANLLEVDSTQWFAPFGVVLFALGGLPAIPEMADMLGKYRKDLTKAVAIGSAAVIVIYGIFSILIVGVTGGGTSEAAVDGLALVVGNWALIVGGIVVFFAAFTSYLLIGISLVESLVNDFRWRFLRAWVFVVIVPLIIFLCGARSFIAVMSFSGAFIFGGTGIIIIYTYIKAKKDAFLPKRHFHIPSWPLYVCAAVFLLGIVATIVELIK